MPSFQRCILLSAIANNNLLQDVLTDLKLLSISASRHAVEIAAVIRMYAKCGCMTDARRVFDSILKPDVISWNALLLGYAANGQGRAALNAYSRMRCTQGCAPDFATYVAALKACASVAICGEKETGLEMGRMVHLQAKHHLDSYVQNTLIDMYGKCGSMVEARAVFDSMHSRDVVSWNALLLGYAQNGEARVMLDLFSRMKALQECRPDYVTFLAAIKACSSLAAVEDKERCLERGKQIHLEIGLQLNKHVQSALVDMYAKLGSMADSRSVFDSIHRPNVVCWNALLLGYAANGEAPTVLHLFSRMKATQSCAPDSLTYVAAVKACTLLSVTGEREEALKRGRELHWELGCKLDRCLQNTLLDMYAKCGCILDARSVFDSIEKPNLASWNALLLGYATNGEGQVALDLFQTLKASRGCDPDLVTYVAALKACTSLGKKGDGLKMGREIHGELRSLRSMDCYVASTLIDMYAKCGSIADARGVFESVEKPDIVCCNALLLGYAENGEGQAALDLFAEMKGSSGYIPYAATYIAVLKACCLTGALALGRKLHSEEINEFSPQVVVCLVDFYGKCGSMIEACDVFDAHPRQREFPTWTALLAGYARFGDAEFVLNLFKALERVGLQPNAVMLVSVLTCCSYAGLVDTARELFEGMQVEYEAALDVMHYNCMVDALGRANQVKEAFEMVSSMRCDPNVATWMSLLSSCCKWKNVEIGERAFRALVELDKKNAPAYVLMAHIYESCSLWEEQHRVLQMKTASDA